jgi:PleD family two-component response regulator
MAAIISERVRRSVTDTAIPTRQGKMPVSVSLGYTVRMPHEDISLELLIARADRGLMMSKTDGRNVVRCAS